MILQVVVLGRASLALDRLALGSQLVLEMLLQMHQLRSKVVAGEEWPWICSRRGRGHWRLYIHPPGMVFLKPQRLRVTRQRLVFTA